MSDPESTESESRKPDGTARATTGAVADGPGAEVATSTSSSVTRRLGLASAVLLAATLLFALVLSPPEQTQRDAARLLYVHLPTIAVTYSAFAITLVGSIIYLRNGSVFWDLLAGASAEIGVLFCGLVLATGAIWGKPTWGVYWQWDPRLTSTTVLFIMYLGYLAVRRLELPPEVRSRRASILGIISFLNVFIVHYSVQWWRGLHQGQTIGLDTQLDDLMLFTLFLSTVSFLALFAWILIHRFRVAWLDREVDRLGLDRALAERRAESGRGIATGTA